MVTLIVTGVTRGNRYLISAFFVSGWQLPPSLRAIAGPGGSICQQIADLRPIGSGCVADAVRVKV